jgi:hypothetical protein
MYFKLEDSLVCSFSICARRPRFCQKEAWKDSGAHQFAGNFQALARVCSGFSVIQEDIGSSAADIDRAEVHAQVGVGNLVAAAKLSVIEVTGATVSPVFRRNFAATSFYNLDIFFLARGSHCARIRCEAQNSMFFQPFLRALPTLEVQNLR